MKKLFLFISIIYVTFILSCNAFAYSPSKVAEKIENFSPEISVDSGDIQQVLIDTFNYDPRLVMYYKGYSGSYNSYLSKINIVYTNQDTQINDIYVAKNKEDFISLITRAMLYSKNKLYVVAENMPTGTTPINDYITSIGESCPIAFMGYSGSNASTLDSKLGNYSCYVIEFNYDFDSTVLLEMKKDLQQRACDIVASNIASDMPPYMKAYIVHNYIVNNCVYATDYETNNDPYYYTAYGALVNGKAVCDGYASAAKILFDLCGIENIKVTGTSKGNGHAWNLIKLDNDYYHIDTTWDDPVSYDGLNYLRYDYYNLTDNEISQDHAWQTQNYPDANGALYTYTKTVELIRNDNNHYTKGYTSFTSVFGKYPQLNGSVNPNIDTYAYTEEATENNTLSTDDNITPIEPYAILDKSEDNLKETAFDMINYFIMKINENPMFYLKLCGILVVLLLLKKLFQKDK